MTSDKAAAIQAASLSFCAQGCASKAAGLVSEATANGAASGISRGFSQLSCPEKRLRSESLLNHMLCVAPQIAGSRKSVNLEAMKVVGDASPAWVRRLRPPWRKLASMLFRCAWAADPRRPALSRTSFQAAH